MLISRPFIAFTAFLLTGPTTTIAGQLTVVPAANTVAHISDPLACVDRFRSKPPTQLAIGDRSQHGNSALKEQDCVRDSAESEPQPTTQPLTPAVDVRTLQSPLDSPPFPSSDYLGPVIGEPEDSTIYPLMKAMVGNTFKPGRIKIYGWINPSVNLSSSSQSNIVDSYDIVPNRLELDQAVLRIERVPDSVQSRSYHAARQ